MSGVAGIEPRSIATLTVVVRRPNHLARSHSQLGQISSIFWFYLFPEGLIGVKSISPIDQKLIDHLGPSSCCLMHCCGSVSELDPYSTGSLDPDPGGQK